FDSFSNRFINPIEKFHNTECQATLKRLISPFILRRNKNEVAKELPPKTEIQIKVNLTQEEMALYENLRRDAMALVLEGTKQSAIQALAELTKLRQAACHPQLINKELKIESSKTAQFMELVLELIENGHRTLAFSQFTSHLALVRKKLDEAGIKYLYLDGTMAPKQRAELVDAFQNGDAPLFLISLKAGGLGLNLTAADYVIHLDPWWNPAVEDQASDRTYRIGQDKPVTIYRLISANTIEEKIVDLHAEKKSLADALLEGSDIAARLTQEDIINLLREK
ncbi:MAG: DEAD/DEAH box helicase, partial [Muribaculaceae bacterium]|nr:DEAD/DEAH box helicase [Muribaculaceae bacterium]